MRVNTATLLALLFVLLFSPPLSAVCPVVTEGGVEHELCNKTYDGDVLFNGTVNIPGGVTDPSVIKRTTANLTLYVRTTGSDSNDCLSAGAACLTIQAAVDKVPKFIVHAVVIDIGEGSFAGFTMAQFFVKGGANFDLIGKLGNPTLTTGTTSGTATGGTTRQLVHSPGQNWTDDELIGMLLKVGSQYRVIRNNTLDTINLAGPFSISCSGQAYEIFEQTTVLNSDSDGNSVIGYFDGIIGATSTPIRIYDVKFDGAAVTYAVFMQYCMNGPYFERSAFVNGTNPFIAADNSGYAFQMVDCCAMGGSSYGFFFLRNAKFRDFNRVLAYNNGSHGIYLTNTANYANMGEIYSDNNTEAGLYVANTQFADVDYGGMDGNSTYGIHIDENVGGGQGDNRRAFSFVNMVGTFDISNNTLGGIIANNHSLVGITAASGTGNGGYGLTLAVGSYATITSATTITGTSGDATITDGSIPLTWATDFASDGDIETNLSNGCRIERRD